MTRLQELPKITLSDWMVDRGVLKCPHPDCEHVAPIITEHHCRLEHGLQRKQIQVLYGKPNNPRRGFGKK